jgi:hypothetical protein
MPLSDNIEADFTHCIQNIQTGMMGNLLQPLTFLTSSLAGAVGSISGELNSVRGMFNKIRGFIQNIVQSIFSVFMNLIIEFIRIIVGMKDLFGKTIGIMVSLMYIMEGSILTMRSAWNGPQGKLVKALGKCFHPHTELKLKNGEIKKMMNMGMGDILANGSRVEAVMQIDNKHNPEMLYVIPKLGNERKDIFVTGSHSIYDERLSRYVKISDYKGAIKTSIKLDWFSCLVTDDHMIGGIGELIFWDWEDQLL